jgi:hypothetical protein
MSVQAGMMPPLSIGSALFFDCLVYDPGLGNAIIHATDPVNITLIP